MVTGENYHFHVDLRIAIHPVSLRNEEDRNMTMMKKKMELETVRDCLAQFEHLPGKFPSLSAGQVKKKDCA